jgi:hypothetical protein
LWPGISSDVALEDQEVGLALGKEDPLCLVDGPRELPALRGMGDLF